MENTHIVCPHCHGVNRIPPQRLGDDPRCGKCHQPLFVGQPVDLDSGNFEKHVSRGDVPVLVDFWAPWCGPCRMMAPAFAEAADRLEPSARLAKVNTEDHQALAGQFAIRSIPTMVLFHKGREVARQSGAMGVAEIERWVRQYL